MLKQLYDIGPWFKSHIPVQVFFTLEKKNSLKGLQYIFPDFFFGFSCSKVAGHLFPGRNGQHLLNDFDKQTSTGTDWGI